MSEQTAPPMSFKDQFIDLQHLVRELTVLRNHNLQFKQEDDHATLLMFAEGAVCLVVLERFLRAVLGPAATEGQTIYNLLQLVVSNGLLTLPSADSRRA